MPARAHRFLIFAILVALATLVMGAQSAIAAPANDDFANAQVVTGDNIDMIVDMQGATFENGEPSPYGRALNGSVWLKWTPSTTQVVDVVPYDDGSSDPEYFNPSMDIVVYDGSSLATLVTAPQPNSYGRGYRVVAGHEYRVQISRGSYGVAQYKPPWRHVVISPVPVMQDDFARANVSILATGVGWFGSDLTSATLELPDEPTHAAAPGATASQWFGIKYRTTQRVFIDTAGSAFDTTIAVYTGGALNALTPVASNDDVQPGVTTTSHVEFTAVRGVTYNVAIGNARGTNGLAIVTFGTPNPADAFATRATATWFGAAGSSWTGFLSQLSAGAGTELGEPTLPPGATSTVWQSLGSQVNGRVALTYDPDGCSTNVVTEVFAGSVLGGLTPVATLNGSTDVAETSFNATPGVTVQVGQVSWKSSGQLSAAARSAAITEYPRLRAVVM